MHDGSQADKRPGDEIHTITPPSTDAQSTQDLPAVQPQRTQQRGVLWDVVETLILALVIFVAVRMVVLNFRVDGESMHPNLDDRQMLLVIRPVYWHFDLNAVLNVLPFIDREGENVVFPFHPPQRGDIIVLHPPVDGGKPYIKRIIGLPGERIAIHDGAVYINGNRLDESYLNGVETAWAGTLSQNELTIPDGQYYVLGDNRANSSDSRAFGPIGIDQIIGRAWISYWPKSDIGILSTPSYPQ
ncbi:MAG: signal peptidase I [Thermomicrobiales bacterium]|nr:signal peptidase I [Thermomicrobiales bacterium]